MLLNIEEYIKNRKGVIHVGGHHGEERDFYKSFSRVVWFEPNPIACKQLEENIKDEPTHKVVNVGIYDTPKKAQLNIANNGQSSSLLELGLHKEYHPQIKYVDKIEVNLIRLDAYFDKAQIVDFNFLNIDVQGVELNVIKSMGDLITHMDYIYVEVNDAEVYEGCSQIQDIDAYLSVRGYTRILTKMTKAHWGDALYIKNTICLNYSFMRMIKKSYAYNAADFINDDRWLVLKHLYETNFLHPKQTEQQIPKIIHQIWLGSPLPSAYKGYTESWKKIHPTWEYHLWTDTNIQGIEMNWHIFNSIVNLGQKSDYLRYHILKQYGGLYADTDFECIKPFDALANLSFYTGIGYPSKVELYIGLFACTKGHPLINLLVDKLDKVQQKGWREIFNTTGSYFFTKWFFTYIIELTASTEGIVAFPTEFFYAFPNNVRKEEKNPKRFLTQISYAIHYWETSWLENNK